MCLKNEKKVDGSSVEYWSEVLGWNWYLRMRKMDEEMDEKERWIIWVKKVHV